MNIYRAMRRDRERARRQDQTVRRDNQDIRSRGSEPLERAFVLQAARLKDIQAARKGQLLDGARRVTQSAPRRPVWLRQYQCDLVAGIEQRRKRASRKLWSTGEY